jgi:hypothetical protein
MVNVKVLEFTVVKATDKIKKKLILRFIENILESLRTLRGDGGILE